MPSAEQPNPLSIDITPNKDGGVLKEIIRAGEGDEMPFSGDSVSVHYVGTLLDGTKFDSSRDRGEKFTFDVGKGSVIKGWDLGVPTMKRGELAKFTIRSEYAYGENGSPPTIPPNATLIFEIELFDFHGEDLSEQKDKSLTRRTIKAGSGYQTPNEGALCVINLKGYDSTGRVFDERENVQVELGEGAVVKVCEAIEHALQRFKKEEHSRLYLKSTHIKDVKTLFGLSDVTEIIYEVELKSFEKAKESWQLNGQEKLQQSELLKNKGTQYFKEGNYKMAAKKYSKIVDFLQAEVYDLDEQKETSNKLQLAANLNLAMCYLKTKEYRKAIESSEKALKLDDKNEKGLFRLAQGYFGLAEYNDALVYFGKVLEVNPANRDAQQQINLSKQKIKESSEREKALYSKMLSAFSK